MGKVIPAAIRADPESIIQAAQAIVKKAPGLMKGHDTSQMGIDDTELGGWTAKQVNKEEQGHPEGGDTAMKQK